VSAITTHVLDTTLGRPAAAVPVMLERNAGQNEWLVVGRGYTDADGRLRTLMKPSDPLVPGDYRLVFDTGRYFDSIKVAAFYPVVVITFSAAEREAHYHVPLLLSPFGYTTYRGS